MILRRGGFLPLTSHTGEDAGGDEDEDCGGLGGDTGLDELQGEEEGDEVRVSCGLDRVGFGAGKRGFGV